CKTADASSTKTSCNARPDHTFGSLGEMHRHKTGCPLHPRKPTSGLASGTSASLIGRLGSSTFRLSSTAVSISLTGSCFSSESAPGPFQYGIRRRGGGARPRQTTDVHGVPQKAGEFIRARGQRL